MADHMEIYGRFLAARDLSEVIYEQHILEREGRIDAADYIETRADRAFRKLAERMGYRIEKAPTAPARAA